MRVTAEWREGLGDSAGGLCLTHRGKASSVQHTRSVDANLSSEEPLTYKGIHRAWFIFLEIIFFIILGRVTEIKSLSLIERNNLMISLFSIYFDAYILV